MGCLDRTNELLEPRIAALAIDLLGKPTSVHRTEQRFRGRGSLVVHFAGPRRGCWHDFEAGVGGDPVGLVAHVQGVPMAALALARAWLGDAAPSTVPASASRPVARPQRPEAASSTRALAQRLWRESVQPFGTLVEVYLRSRGLHLPHDAPLRFHPRCWRKRAYGLHGPAMLALMTDPVSGEPCATHVTYLRPDGSGKAAGEPKKIMLGNSGVVRLVPDEDVALGLVIAEGIETAASVLARGWSPVWAAGSACGVEAFPVLPGVECITVFADQGERGVEAAARCAGRWRAAGREAHVVAPLRGGDWNDAVREDAA